NCATFRTPRWAPPFRTCRLYRHQSVNQTKHPFLRRRQRAQSVQQRHNRVVFDPSLMAVVSVPNSAHLFQPYVEDAPAIVPEFAFGADIAIRGDAEAGHGAFTDQIPFELGREKRCRPITFLAASAGDSATPRCPI